MDERGGLENRYAFRRIVGSNPTPSAILDIKLAPYPPRLCAWAGRLSTGATERSGRRTMSCASVRIGAVVLQRPLASHEDAIVQQTSDGCVIVAQLP